MKRIIPLVFACFSVWGCARDADVGEPSGGPTRTDPYRISQREALRQLDMFLAEVGDPATRSASRGIASVEALGGRTFGASTRAGVGVSLPDTLFYLVNFDDSSGFALLAADRRLEYPLYAVTEKGSLSAADFRPDDLSSPGPLPREAIEWLNDSTDNTPWEPYPDFPTMFRNLLAPALAAQFNPYAATRDVPWRTIEKYGPHLRNKWHQRAPYNAYCPIKGTETTLAGCGPVAVAQIANFHRYPNRISTDYIDWYYANMSDNIYNPVVKTADSARVSHYAALAVRAVGHLCSVKYGVSGSSCSAADAKDCFEAMGYRDVEKFNQFRSRKIEAMVHNGKPVYVAGRRKWWNFGPGSGGHAWVIDGLYKRERYAGSDYQYQTLLHCCFGWADGVGNGYYNHDFFDTAAPVDYEPGIDNPNAEPENTYIYEHHFRVITYNMP